MFQGQINILLLFKASGEKKEYAGWALGVAALLAVSSLIPILIGVVVHLVKRFSTTNNKHAYEAGKFYRVDTTASTRPMLGDNYEVSIFHSLSSQFILLIYSCVHRSHAKVKNQR